MTEAPSPEAARRTTLRSVVGAALLVLLVALGAAGLKSWRDLGAAQAREAELEERIEAARGRIGRLERRIELLTDDPVTLERLAREELGLVRPGDWVIVLPEAGEDAEPRVTRTRGARAGDAPPDRRPSSGSSPSSR